VAVEADFLVVKGGDKKPWVEPECCKFCLACPNGLKIGSEIN
jgi:hypothetical protein